MSWSRRSHRHNRASDDYLSGDWAAQDQPSGSYSGYAAGNSHTQHGSYNPGYGGSSYTSQNSYSHHGPADPNYMRSQQQQYQEQSRGYGSQRSQGYDSEEEENFEVRSQIRFARDPSVRDTRSALNAAQGAEVSSLGIPNNLSTQGARLHNTERDHYGASNQNHFAEDRGRNFGNQNSSMFVPNMGNPLGSRSRAQEDEAVTLARHRAEREESFRARESSHGNQYRSQYPSGGGYY